MRVYSSVAEKVRNANRVLFLLVLIGGWGVSNNGYLLKTELCG